MPGTFVANAEYWQSECKAVPKNATYIKLTAGEVTDYFKPKNAKTMCDMLTSGDQHTWSSTGKSSSWVTPNASTVGLGGSADGWLTAQKLADDQRDTPSFWGVKTPNAETGGCCHTDYKAEGKAWAKPYRMDFCGMSQVLAPICTPLVTVAGSFSADKAFWTETCKTIPMTAGFVKVAMGDSIDYFRPPTGKTYCEMLTGNDQHKWSKDGYTWVDPTYDTSTSGLGGSADAGVTTGDARTKVSFWGSDTATDTGGCCYASLADQTPGFGKAFTMSYCEIATATPVNQLVESLHSTEASVMALEQEVANLHSRLTSAEGVNVDASGNVSLARSGMYKLAVKAKDEADQLSTFQLRSSILGSSLDREETQLTSSKETVIKSMENTQAVVAVANKTATQSALGEQDTLNDQIWALMDPSNTNSLDATEKRIRLMEEDEQKFKKQLGDEIKTVMVTKMRRSVHRLRKMINRLGNAGNRNSDGALGQVDSDASLGSDLGLDDA